MWWLVVFWILFVVLIIAEIIIYFTTKKYAPLIYALAAFAYVVTVTYTIDVFDLNRNVVILILLASAGIMVLLGKQLQKGKYNLKAERTAAIAIAAAIILIFVVSIIFGRLSESVQPVESVAAAKIAYSYDEKGREIGASPNSPVTILNRTLHNSFFMPAPVKAAEYKICLVTNSSTYDMWSAQAYPAYPEVAAHSTEVMPVRVSPITIPQREQPKEILVYRTNSTSAYTPCATLEGQEPAYRIPVR